MEAVFLVWSVESGFEFAVIDFECVVAVQCQGEVVSFERGIIQRAEGAVDAENREQVIRHKLFARLIKVKVAAEAAPQI